MAEASDILGMSDEDFLKDLPALENKSVEKPEPDDKAVETAVVPVVVEKPVVEPVVEPKVPPVVEPKAKTKEKVKVEGNPDPLAETTVKDKGKTKPKTSDVTETPTEVVASTEETDDESEEEEVVAEEKEGDAHPDYESFYKQVMTPFKANGRTVELKTPEEAIQLMQMGANYTKKMQELVPHRKMITMLQNNGLLDEGKISYLIDLDKKNPDAIKKLVKDAGMDPMDIDVSVEPTYREGNHRVSDEEVNFHSTLEDMKSTPEKLGTLQVINSNWDQASKEALWKSPQIMSEIHKQRETGIYDRIATEVNRLQMLGSIPQNVPFLQAYKTIGDQMTNANAFADLGVRKVPPTKVAVVATRVEAPKPTLKNGAKAAAASPNRTSAATKTPLVNVLAMSDSDFLKQFAGRV